MIHQIFQTKHSVFTAPDVHMHTSLSYTERERERERETDRQTDRDGDSDCLLENV